MATARFLSMALALLWCTLALNAQATAIRSEPAQVSVIVNHKNREHITKTDIYRIYLGKKRFFPNGRKALPLELDSGDPIRQQFLRRALNKTEAQWESYWAYRTFRHKGGKPQSVVQQLRLLEMVANNPKYIGYIDSRLVDDRVTVIQQY